MPACRKAETDGLCLYAILLALPGMRCFAPFLKSSTIVFGICFSFGFPLANFASAYPPVTLRKCVYNTSIAANACCVLCNSKGSQLRIVHEAF
jgi:hypothetical protein